MADCGSLTNEYLKKRVHALFFSDTPSETEQVGLELEVWPFRNGREGQAELVRFFNDQGTGLIDLLVKFQQDIPGLNYTPTAEGDPKFLFDQGGNLTFEPGGQLEYSGPPKNSLAESIADITAVIENLRCLFKEHGIWFFHSGLNPWFTVEEVGLQLKKDRYLHMNDFFRSIGPYGQQMMRLSTSLQVNLDHGDLETAKRRWLAAYLLAPLFTALFGNSPFAQGRATGAYSYRSIIWQKLDPSRTGIPPLLMAEKFDPCPIQQYTDFALDALVFQLPNEQGTLTFDGRKLTFRQWMDQGTHGRFPNEADWDRHLSTLFPEVRARGFFEVRFMDAQSKVWCAIPGILLTNLLYNAEATEKVIQKLGRYRTTLTGMLDTAARKGMDESEIADLAIDIFKLAKRSAIDNGEDGRVLTLCDRFYEHYTHQRRNPAAELVRLNDGKVFTPTQYRAFEAEQLDQAGDVLDIICDYF